MKNSDLLERIRGARCAVLGLGVSNLPLVDFLLAHGAQEVTVHDKKSVGELGEKAERLLSMGVKFITGEEYLKRIDADVIFRSPGIRDDKDGIPEAVKAGAILTSEMELFFDITPAHVLAITGSDGKTTTTTLTSLILQEELKKKGEGRVFLGGNIGQPLLPLAEQMTERDYAVVELSSFQLKTMNKPLGRAIITNITPNHLDWHTDMSEYIDAKFNICRGGVERLVTNAENAITRELARNLGGKVTYFSSKKNSFGEICGEFPGEKAIFERDGEIIISDGIVEKIMLKTADIRLVGRHNVENYMAAIGILDDLVSAESVRRVATTFGGVEHRLEFVRELDGVKYYNSSIDSTPTRSAAALSALDKAPIMICGGYDKHIPFDSFGEVLCRKAKAVILTGATAFAIRSAVEACPLYPGSGLELRDAADFDEAVTLARSLAESGDIVLLSPACASFDAFRNFEERGRHFKALVNNMK